MAITFLITKNFIAITFFVFLIQIDEITSDVSLIVTDFAEDEDDKEFTHKQNVNCDGEMRMCKLFHPGIINYIF